MGSFFVTTLCGCGRTMLVGLGTSTGFALQFAGRFAVYVDGWGVDTTIFVLGTSMKFRQS
jgi:hypothetical protein